MVEKGELYQLLVEAKAGNRPAMDQLLLAVRPLLEKHASRYADPSCAAQSTSDLIQEAWLRAWLKLDQFSNQEAAEGAAGKFLAWVEKIVKSVGLNAVRDRKALRRKPSSPILRIDGPTGEDPSLDVAAQAPSPSAGLHEQDRSRVLREAIDRLGDETDRVILRIRFFEGLPLKRVAERLELDYSEVTARYRASVQKLERELREKL